jgi:putative oxidoreductase
MIAKLLTMAVRLGLGCVFIYAALSKVPAFDTFAEELANYRLLPALLVAPLAVAMPGIELAGGVLLVLGRWVRPAALLLGLLLVVFIIALSQALRRGINLSCGCFGGSEVATWGTVARDGVLLIGSAFVAFRSGGSSSALNSPLPTGKR